MRKAALKANMAQKEFDRYELWNTQAGAVIYRLKPTAANGEPTHFLCPACKEKGVKAILQGREFHKGCPVCKVGYNIEDSPTEVENDTPRIV